MCSIVINMHQTICFDVSIQHMAFIHLSIHTSFNSYMKTASKQINSMDRYTVIFNSFNRSMYSKSIHSDPRTVGLSQFS